jgi:uncharacterized protein YndB with AHSA1/START domain
MTAVAATPASAMQKSTTHVYRVYIKATPQAIWDAITKRDWIERYGYACPADYDLRPGGAYKAYANEAMKAYGPTPDVIIVGEVIESDPPRKLVQTWHPVWDPASEAEPATRLTFEISENPQSKGVSILTVTHDVTGAPSVAAITSGENLQAGGGWAYILSDLKTLLETGKALTA